MNDELIKENKAMKAAVIVSWVLIFGSTLLFLIVSHEKFDGFLDGVKATLVMLLIMLMIFGSICGAAHTSALRKKTHFLLAFPLIGWIPWLYAQLVPIMFTGCFFLIIDTVKMILKMPLKKAKKESLQTS